MLLVELRKDRKWLSQFLIYNNASLKVDVSLPIIQILNSLPDTLLANLLSELTGIKRIYENNGFPKDFDSAPPSDFSPTFVSADRLGLLESLNLTELEALVLLHLFLDGVQTASDVSRATGIQRTEVYNYISGLLKKGAAVSTNERPQKFYCATEIALKLSK
jgi:hypothetical protein